MTQRRIAREKLVEHSPEKEFCWWEKAWLLQSKCFRGTYWFWLLFYQKYFPSPHRIFQGRNMAVLQALGSIPGAGGVSRPDGCYTGRPALGTWHPRTVTEIPTGSCVGLCNAAWKKARQDVVAQSEYTCHILCCGGCFNTLIFSSQLCLALSIFH